MFLFAFFQQKSHMRKTAPENMQLKEVHHSTVSNIQKEMFVDLSKKELRVLEMQKIQELANQEVSF